ncbi:MAG TPA: long-chain-fatty-acid--CoA ligase [Ramlibacter sp.]|nr:long-chain-fatty-acid--CoA ligase [Ramlibacter sp.]
MRIATLAPEPAHWRVWPDSVPHAIVTGDQTLCQMFAARAQAAPEAIALHFLGRSYRWRELDGAAQRLAGALQRLGVGQGDRVLLFMQNCPQFVIGLHAVARAGAMVVPVNPMNKSDELSHYIADAGARVAIASSDIAVEMARASDARPPGQGLHHLVVFDLADALAPDANATCRDWPAAWQGWLATRHQRPRLEGGQCHEWNGLLAEGAQPRALACDPSDMVLLPYTSGTTGQPKGCMHTHATLLHNAAAAAPWLDMKPGDVVLVVVPMFHITGLVMGLLAAIHAGCSVVLLPRWDRLQAARAIARHRVTHWPNIPTMVIDLLAAPELPAFDLASLRYIGGGGAPMPEAVAMHLHERFGLEYVEGYGLTETAAPTHINPRNAPRRQCLGIPYVGTEALVIDPETLQPMAAGEVGEIVVHGPQLFKGYWRQPEATREAMVEVEGRHYFRTGDLGRFDADGYFYLADRLKRMINVSGFKVWPAEVEALLHRHPAVQEVCVIARRDPYRGETVKAVIVPRPGHRPGLSERAVIDWAREHMAAYKYPREIEFVDDLPRSGSGKVLWRALQARQDAREPGVPQSRSDSQQGDI